MDSGRASLSKYVLQCILSIFRWERVLPTILRIGPYRFYFYSHEPNEPPHVHIDRKELSAKFWLKKVILANNIEFTEKELNKLHKLVDDHQQQFLDKWHEYFNTKN